MTTGKDIIKLTALAAGAVDGLVTSLSAMAGVADVRQDAVVRVYVHKLRRKLDDYYAGPGAQETLRLSLPNDWGSAREGSAATA